MIVLMSVGVGATIDVWTPAVKGTAGLRHPGGLAAERQDRWADAKRPLIYVRSLHRFWTRWRLPLVTCVVLCGLFGYWYRRQQSLMRDALARAGLAPVPDSAAFTFVSRENRFAYDATKISFKASSEAVRLWWERSPGTKGAETPPLQARGNSVRVVATHPPSSIPPDSGTTFNLSKNPRNGGAWVAVAPDGTVDITVVDPLPE